MREAGSSLMTNNHPVAHMSNLKLRRNIVGRAGYFALIKIVSRFDPGYRPVW